MPNNRLPPGTLMRMLGANLLALGAPSTDPGAGQRAFAQGMNSTNKLLIDERTRRDAQAYRDAQMKIQQDAAARAAETHAQKQKRIEAWNRMFGGAGSTAAPQTGGASNWVDPDTGQPLMQAMPDVPRSAPPGQPLMQNQPPAGVPVPGEPLMQNMPSVPGNAPPNGAMRNMPMPGAPQGATKRRSPFSDLTPQQAAAIMMLGPERGAALLAQQAFKDPTKPNTIKGADGYQYYMGGPNHGKRVLPGITAKTNEPGEVGTVAQFRLPNEDVVHAYFDKRARAFMYRDREGNSKKLPYGALKVTPSSTGQEKMKPGELLKLRTAMGETEAGIRQVTKYMETVQNSEQGFDLLADKWTAKIKTVFGGIPSASELAVMESDGRLQALLGRFRKEVVGGGVMTEQDAMRILSALGGEPDATRHPEIVRRLLANITNEKIQDYNSTLLPMFNDQVKRSGVYKKREKLVLPDVFKTSSATDDIGTPPSGVTPAEWKAMTPEERALFK